MFYKYWTGQIARLKSIGRTRVCKTCEKSLIFRARTFCLATNKSTLDLQILCRIGKTMKKLQNKKL